MDFLTGWGGFFTLAFFQGTVLLIVGAVCFAVVVKAALKAKVRPWIRAAVVLAAIAGFGVLLTAGLLAL